LRAIPALPPLRLPLSTTRDDARQVGTISK
jgi:hypothetical protein